MRIYNTNSLSCCFIIPIMVLAVGIVILAGGAQAQQPLSTVASPIEKVLYSFGGKAGDGESPFPSLTKDTRGALYGTTRNGGSFGFGAVFKLSPPARGKTQWTETVLYSFGGKPGDGKSPTFQGSLVFGDDGALYGATEGGGSYDRGAVFRLTPPDEGETQWIETVLYSFGRTPDDGSQPSAGLILDERGRIYGTTREGGGANAGTVFRLKPPSNGRAQWTETVLYKFRSLSDGAAPNCVIFDDRGGLYGATMFGGSGVGTLFQLTPPARAQTQWTKTVLYNFGGNMSPGSNLLLDKHGTLYGTEDTGIVYKVTPPTAGQTRWTKTDLYSPGQMPSALIMDRRGALYGAAATFDAVFGPSAGGFAYKLTPPPTGQTQWIPTILHEFRGAGDGSYPMGGLIFGRQGALYGATVRGGASGVPTNITSGDGTIYQVQLPEDDND